MQDELTAMSSSDGALREQLPREQRQSRLIQVTIKTGLGVQFDAYVANMSLHGMGIRSKEPVFSGERVEILKKGFHSITGTIAWAAKGRFGIQFAEPLNLQAFEFKDQNGHVLTPKQVSSDDRWKGFSGSSDMKRPAVSSRFSG